MRQLLFLYCIVFSIATGEYSLTIALAILGSTPNKRILRVKLTLKTSQRTSRTRHAGTKSSIQRMTRAVALSAMKSLMTWSRRIPRP